MRFVIEELVDYREELLILLVWHDGHSSSSTAETRPMNTVSGPPAIRTAGMAPLANIVFGLYQQNLFEARDAIFSLQSQRLETWYFIGTEWHEPIVASQDNVIDCLPGLLAEGAQALSGFRVADTLVLNLCEHASEAFSFDTQHVATAFGCLEGNHVEHVVEIRVGPQAITLHAILDTERVTDRLYRDPDRTVAGKCYRQDKSWEGR
jgi:hypothetical protein